jgi:hypothetical protein
MWFAVSLAPASARSQGAAAPASCATAMAAGMSAFDAARAGSMVGTFELIMIDTTSLRGGPRQHTGKLTLAFQDSVPKRRASMAKAVEQKFIVGVFEAAPPDTGEMWSRMTSRAPDAPGVFWSDGFLRMGEFGPKSGVSLYVHSMGADELRGIWTTQAGTAVIVDFTGDKEPDEAGYFCARRVR